MSTRLDPDALAALEQQRDFLLASLRDLDREHDAGDLDEIDHQTLRDDYTARTAEVLRAIDAQEEAFAAARRPRSPKRTAMWFVGVVAFAVIGVGALVYRFGDWRPSSRPVTAADRDLVAAALGEPGMSGGQAGSDDDRPDDGGSAS